MDDVSHDVVTDYLRNERLTARGLWELVARLIEDSPEAFMLVNDSVQDKRYSWGYPAIPELEDHPKVFQLLPAVEKELGIQLGIQLSPAYQLIPEQSTAAIILHHPQAKYYSVGESRVEQLMKR